MITLRPYQEEGLNCIYKYFVDGGKGNPVVAWPTGTGKSVVPAVFIHRAMSQWPNQRFLMITHVKELIQQNLDVLRYVWPNAPVGVYSAGLKQKDVAFPIIFGGIQSMIKNIAAFGWRDMAFVDEAHLISLEESSMYQTFIGMMKMINPHFKVVGMTATPWRMGQGYITDPGSNGSALFTDIVQDLTGVDSFNRLIAEGYLAQLVPKRTNLMLDVSNVGMAKGEFVASQLQSAIDKAEITYAGLRELCELGYDRKSWLIFASGIEHAEHIAAMLGTFGVECAAVHSKQKSEYNDAAIKAFKEGRLRAISNYGKLTTGFNHPGIDLIGMFRPTLSVPLWVQMLGRGTRPADGKENCLVLDFARNTPRLGPINDPIIPRRKGESQGDAPIKICEVCGVYNHAKVRFCCNCQNEFEFKVKIVKSAGTEELLRSDLPIVETFNVQYVTYAKKEGKLDKETNIKKPPYIQATYFCGMRAFKENVFPEHGGFVTVKFKTWWQQRHTIEPPKTTDEVLQHMAQLRTPKSIRVWVNRKYPEVVGQEY